MIKATELRIGNWLMTKKGARRVAGASDDDILLFCDGAYRARYLLYAWDELTPIPLTEEWLRKFGMVTLDCEVDVVEWGFSNPNGNNFCLVSDGLDTPYPLYFEYDLGLGDIRREIKYVHQLQNLYFALTGQELTLKEPI